VTETRLFELLEQFFVRCLSVGESEGIDRLVELELSITQARTVFTVSQAAEPLPINALADLIGLSVAATGRNVDQLVHTGLLERRESTDDRRVKLVSITAAGREAVVQHLEAKRASIRALIARLEPEHAQRLAEALEPIVAGEALRPVPQESVR
jgi:DNA-binding MarR family transcriptional regulator